MAVLPQQENTTLYAIERAVESRPSESLRGHLGASQIGAECERDLWYSFRWATMKEHPARILRLFDRGNREEPALVSLLREAGLTIHEIDEAGQQFRVSAIGGHFGGSMDGCGVGFVEAPEKWHVLEFKTHNDKSFKALQKGGVEKSKPQHYAQMQIYMLLSGMDRAYYLAVNKNDDELHGERVRFAQKKADALFDRAKRIIASDRPPAKVSEDPAWYQCKFCNHQQTCHGEKAPIPTCRSCIHATPEMDGDARWSCALHQRDLTKDEQMNGCPSHLYIPDLLANWAKFQDAGENDVQYLNTKLNRPFVNGPSGYSSIEIYKAVPDMIGNEVVDALKSDMGAVIEKAHATV